MAQVLTLPELVAGIAVRQFGPEKYSDEEYWGICEANRDLHIERTAAGEIVIMPPCGPEADYRNGDVFADLKIWSRSDGRGKAFGPTVQFFLPDGSAFSPDAAWVSNESLRRFTKQELRRFVHLSPEFVIEVMSPSDRLKEAKEKMELWISNRVELAWLIDADAQTVYVYRKGHAPKTRKHLKQIAGEGPVAGFVLNLAPIWEGL